ncbi:titin [Culicoides brevitarsis]|uniref:titin n=1 Tax=Culicoides brevitarsis TaxID=469753 RepID=UPI00307BD03B
MLSNTSSSGEGAAESTKSSGVRKLVKRSTNKDGVQSHQKPRMSKLGMKSGDESDSKLTKRGVRRLGGEHKTPESSNVSSVAGGSDSEWSDKNSSVTKRFDASVADEWNRKSATTDMSWDDNATTDDTWDDLKDFEPVCVKKKMYKCGPVEDEAQVFPRLQAPGTFQTPKKDEERRFKNPEMNFMKQEIEEKFESPTNFKQQEAKPSFLDQERFAQQQQQTSPQPQTSWLRSSWLGNVSKSVASLTAVVSQNLSAALDTSDSSFQPQTEDLRQLVAERLNQSAGDPEESPRKGGRKYLHKVGIDDDIRPVYAFQQKTHDTNRQTEVPSTVAKPQKLETADFSRKQGTNQSISAKKESKSTTDDWNESWDQDNFEPIVTKPQAIRKVAKKVDQKTATQGFLQQEVTRQEAPVMRKEQKKVESAPKVIESRKEEVKKDILDKEKDIIPVKRDVVLEELTSQIMPKEEVTEQKISKTEEKLPNLLEVSPKEIESESWDAWNDDDEEISEPKVEEKLHTEPKKVEIVQETPEIHKKTAETEVKDVEADSWDAWNEDDEPIVEPVSVPKEEKVEEMPKIEPKVVLEEQKLVQETENFVQEGESWNDWAEEEPVLEDIQPKISENVVLSTENVPEVETKDSWDAWNDEDDPEIEEKPVKSEEKFVSEVHPLQKIEVTDVKSSEIELSSVESQEKLISEVYSLPKSEVTDEKSSEIEVSPVKSEEKVEKPSEMPENQEIPPPENDSWNEWGNDDEPKVEIPSIQEIPPTPSTPADDWNTWDDNEKVPEVSQDVTKVQNDVPEVVETELPPIIEPEITKKDMYKCGHELEDAPESPKIPLDTPLKIAINEEEQEWNDWDQEMIVETPVEEDPIVTLHTPVTEMHLSSSVKPSHLHSPPYTIDNERVRGGRGSICEFEEYIPPLGDMTKQEMEARIKASLSVEMNKFFEQTSDNEWNESESEMVFEEENELPTLPVIREGIVSNDWLMEEKPAQKQVSSLLKAENDPIPVEEAPKMEETDKKSKETDTNLPKNDKFSTDDAVIDLPEIDIEPEVVKKDMYKCGSEEETQSEGPLLLSSATTHIEIPPIQEIVEETVEYTTVKDQCFSVPVPSVIPSMSESLESAPKESNLEQKPVESSKLLTTAWNEDDWGSNISDPGTSEQVSDSESDENDEEEALDESHPDVRQSTKQKTVEECINLLKQNRERLEEKQREQERLKEQTVVECGFEEEYMEEQKMMNLEENRASEEKPREIEPDLESQIIPHRSAFSPEPPQQTSVSWEDDEEDLSLVVSNSGPRPEAPTGQDSPKPQVLSASMEDDEENPGVEEPIVVSRDMYKCGTPEIEEANAFDEDPIETFESRKVEGSENKRPEPIGASLEQEIVSASPLPEEIEPEIHQEKVVSDDFEVKNEVFHEETTEDAGWDDWNDDEEPQEVEKIESKQEIQQELPKNESADADDDDWGDNWGDEEEENVKPQEERKESNDKEVTDVSAAEAETSNDNDWDDFDAWGEEDPAVEDNFQASDREIVQETPVFKVPDAPTHTNYETQEEKAIENVFSKLENKNQWNWKTNWGVSLLANASKNVANLTAQVSQNLTSALDTGLIPQPEEMAKIIQKDETRKRTASESSQKSRQSKESSVEPTSDHNQESDRSRKSSVESLPESRRNPSSFIPLTNLVTGVTQISSKVITGGLDTLEGIGKKTFTMIQENVKDVDRKGLSDLLNEAKLENTPEAPKAKLPEFEIMFDDYKGLVHLEALEILATQATLKIERALEELSGDELKKMEETLQEVEELSAVPDSSEIEDTEGSLEQVEDRLLFAVRDLDVEITFEDIHQASKRINKYLMRNAPKADAKELYEKALDALAEFTGLAMGRYQKLAELLSVAEYHSTASEIDALTSLTSIFYWQINNIANRFNKHLNNLEKSEENQQFITNIFLEASNANSYVAQAFKQFTPILKVGATR